jgi:DNA-binding NarL/FixJ family response regulator
MGDRKGSGRRGREDAFAACLRRLGATPRETQIARLVTLLYTNRGIASELGISVATVKRHLEHLYPKLNVRDRHELAARIRTAMERRRA